MWLGTFRVFGLPLHPQTKTLVVLVFKRIGGIYSQSHYRAEYEKPF